MKPITVIALLSALGVLALIEFAGLHLDYRAPLIGVGLLLATGFAWAIGKQLWRYASAVRDTIYAMALFTLVALTGAIASYPIAKVSSGLYDAELLRFDTLMHFDWTVMYAFVAEHPVLHVLGTLAYRTIFLTPALLLTYWTFTGQQERSYRFVFEFWCSAVVTLGLFALMPAAGPLAYMWHGPIYYMPDSELCQPHLIDALRAESVRLIDVGDLCGLVSAPSFHSVAAVLFFRSAFVAGPLKWLIIVLSVAMLLSTPIEGTHYLIDIVLGVAVAAVVLLAIDLAARAIARKENSKAST